MKWLVAIVGLVVVQSGAQAQRILTERVEFPAAGGTVKALEGLVNLVVQPGTLATEGAIPISSNPLVPTPPDFLLESAVSIGLPGTVFLQPVVLQMEFAGLSLPSGTTLASLRVYQMWNHRWTPVPGSFVNQAGGFVQAKIFVGGTFGLFARTSGNPPAENLISFRSQNQDAATSWRRVQPGAGDVNGLASGFEELSRDADTWPGSELAPTENGVMFIRRHPTGSDFYLAAIDGTVPVRFTDLNFSATTGGDFSGNGQKFVFTAQVAGVWKLYRAVAGGGAPTVLATFPIAPASAPAVNPNGTQIAVGMTGGGIWLYAMDTGALMLALGTGGIENVLEVQYSPSGSMVGFLADGGGYPGAGFVCAVSTANTGLRRSSSYGVSIAWDPTSTKIAYGRNDVWVLTVANGATAKTVYLNGILRNLIWR